jgi:hypothetical protein
LETPNPKSASNILLCNASCLQINPPTSPQKSSVDISIMRIVRSIPIVAPLNFRFSVVFRESKIENHVSDFSRNDCEEGGLQLRVAIFTIYGSRDWAWRGSCCLRREGFHDFGTCGEKLGKQNVRMLLSTYAFMRCGTARCLNAALHIAQRQVSVELIGPAGTSA